MGSWSSSSSQSLPLLILLISSRTTAVNPGVWEKRWESSLIFPFHLHLQFITKSYSFHLLYVSKLPTTTHFYHQRTKPCGIVPYLDHCPCPLTLSAPSLFTFHPFFSQKGFLFKSDVWFCVFFFFLFLSRPVPYGSSRAGRWIGAVAAGLHNSHSNTRSMLPLWPVLQLAAMPDP